MLLFVLVGSLAGLISGWIALWLLTLNRRTRMELTSGFAYVGLWRWIWTAQVPEIPKATARRARGGSV